MGSSSAPELVLCCESFVFDGSGSSPPITGRTLRLPMVRNGFVLLADEKGNFDKPEG